MDDDQVGALKGQSCAAAAPISALASPVLAVLPLETDSWAWTHLQVLCELGSLLALLLPMQVPHLRAQAHGLGFEVMQPVLEPVPQVLGVCLSPQPVHIPAGLAQTIVQLENASLHILHLLQGVNGRGYRRHTHMAPSAWHGAGLGGLGVHLSSIAVPRISAGHW